MSRETLAQSFIDHEVWQKIALVKEELKTKPPKSDLDKFAIRRIHAALGALNPMRDLAVEVITPAALEEMNSVLPLVEQIRSQLQAWDSSAAMSDATISNIHTSIDNVLQSVKALPLPPVKSRLQVGIDEVRAVRETIDSYQRTLNDEISSVRASQQQAEQFRAELESDAEVWRAEAANIAQEVKSDTASRIEKLLEEFDGELEEQRSKMDTQLEELKALRELGGKLTKQIGDQAKAEGYAELAISEHKTYITWNLVGGVAVLSFIILLIWLYFNGESTLPQVLTKFTLALGAGGLSTYAFRQATQSKRYQLEAKYKALDMMAITPYMEGLNDELRQELQKFLGLRLFDHPFGVRDSGKTSDSSATVNRAEFREISQLLRDVLDHPLKKSGDQVP